MNNYVVFLLIASMKKETSSRNAIIIIQLFAIQFIRTDRMCNITLKTNKSSLYGEQNVLDRIFTHVCPSKRLPNITGGDHLYLLFFYLGQKFNKYLISIEKKPTNRHRFFAPLLLSTSNANRIFYFFFPTKPRLTLSLITRQRDCDCNINFLRTLHND